MTWTYKQSTGEIFHNGRVIGRGYAGKNGGKNNPAMQSVSATGPLPQGFYTIIGHPFTHPHTGAYSIRLQPSSGNIMFGRSGFLIHGDSRNHPGDASDGCIVLARHIREVIWNSGDMRLEVIK